MHAFSDRRRFRRLYERHYQALLAYALRRTGEPADAADVVAESFLVAWRRLAAVPEEPDTLPWLYGVAQRTLANQRRGEGRRERLRSQLARQPRPWYSLEHELERRAELRELTAALLRLDELEQEVLRLAAWEGLGGREIAVVLGCSDNAAALRLHRARRRLAEELEKGSGAAGQTAEEGDAVREEP